VLPSLQRLWKCSGYPPLQLHPSASLRLSRCPGQRLHQCKLYQRSVSCVSTVFRQAVTHRKRKVKIDETLCDVSVPTFLYVYSQPTLVGTVPTTVPSHLTTVQDCVVRTIGTYLTRTVWRLFSFLFYIIVLFSILRINDKSLEYRT
jgi:hypothetical protein